MTRPAASLATSDRCAHGLSSLQSLARETFALILFLDFAMLTHKRPLVRVIRRGLAALVAVSLASCGWVFMPPAQAQGVRPALPASTVQVAFSPDGSALALVLEAIYAAKRDIRVAAYSFTSAPVTRALIDARKQGVSVSVIVDSSQNQSKYSRAALSSLVTAGVAVRTTSAYAIFHDKFIVVDGQHVQTGSFNYSAAAASKNSENVLVVWSNPALAAQYLKHWSSRFDGGSDYVLSY
jgi:phosphatidylserine/phosphatidylglycerophosphate/cardiolipin synthase-like enzyme